MAGLVERQHHIAAAGELDGEAVLGLARIDIAVDGEDAGRRDLRRRVRRDVEQGAHGVALGALEPDILDPDAACGLREVGEQLPATIKIRPTIASVHLPRIVVSPKVPRRSTGVSSVPLQLRFGCG